MRGTDRSAQPRFVPIGTSRQVLSLASTRPERYHDFAVDSINVVLEPIAAVYQRLGIGAKEARARSSLLVFGLRGLCQDRTHPEP